MSLFGMKHDELSKLAKRFKESKEFLGLSNEEVAKLLNVSVGEIKWLEAWAMVNMKPEVKDEKCT